MAEYGPVTLALLVVLSGCAGLVPIGDSPDASPTPAAPRSYAEAVEDHSSTLRDSGQFRLRRVESVTYPDRVTDRSPVATELVADFDADRYLLGDDLEEHNLVYRNGALYQSGSATWQRRHLENGTTVYRRVPPDSELRVRAFVLVELWAMENHSTQFPFERNGTAVFQGQRVTRYTADELGGADRCLLQPPNVLGNVTSVGVVALVDERGIIRQFECTLSGESITGERFTERLRWTVTGIGLVEIRAPAPLVNETESG